KLLAANPNILDPNQIFPGDTIELSSREDSMRMPAKEEVETTTQTVTSTEEAAPTAHGYNGFAILPKFSYFRLDSTDSTNGGSSTFLSNLDPGFDFVWNRF